MGQLRDGVWTDSDSFPTDDGGRFVRPPSRFRWEGPEPFVAEPDRYHLYLAHACPWSQRTAIALRLKGLEERISVSFVHPILREGGWRFSLGHEDPLYGLSYLHQLYTRADPRFTGRVTVPVLWDRKRELIVSNESEQIVRMFDQAGHGPALYPEPLRAEIDAINGPVYAAVNNGVYRCGFAKSQAAYDEAFLELFAMLDQLSERLRDEPYLVGEYATEADIRLFVTLVRFDAVYYGHFKCNRNRIEDDPVLQSYLERLWTIAPFRETTRLDEIKLHYYGSHRELNPSGIVPLGPRLKLTAG